MSQNFKSQIIDREARLRQAMLTSDVAELDRLIASELIFTNHLGLRISKEQDLEMHRSGILQLTELKPSEQHIQLYDEFAVVSVKMHLRGAYADQAVHEQIRYTRIWTQSSAGSLQIVAGHASVVISE